MCRPGRGELAGGKAGRAGAGELFWRSGPESSAPGYGAGIVWAVPAAAMTYRALRPSKPAAVAALSPAGFLGFPGRLPLCGPVAADVVDVKLLGVPVRRWRRLLVVRELVDAEHE